MSLIIISADLYESGRAVAEKAAAKLNYRLIDRELLTEAAAHNEVPEAELKRALAENPSLFGMRARPWRRALAVIQKTVLERLLADDAVCHGLGAHLYVVGVSHALKVRVLADAEKEAAVLAEQERIPADKAMKRLEQRKQLRRRWSRSAFGMDETDPGLYDLVIGLSNIDLDEAVQTICDTASYRKFQPMSWSQKCLADLELAARVRTVLLERFPDLKVSADGGTLVVEVRAMKREKRRKAEAIKEMAGRIAGVEYVEVHVVNDIFRQAAESFR